MIKCRALSVSDAAEMARVHGSAFDSGQAWTEAAFGTLLAQPTTRAEGAFSNAEMTAFILIQCIVGEAEILTLATDIRFQRQGLASRVFASAQARLFSEGLTRWLLDVAADNAGAIGFYEQLDFQVDGRRRDYYARLDGQRVDAILMSKTVGGQA